MIRIGTVCTYTSTCISIISDSHRRQFIRTDLIRVCDSVLSVLHSEFLNHAWSHSVSLLVINDVTVLISVNTLWFCPFVLEPIRLPNELLPTPVPPQPGVMTMCKP